MKFRIITTVLCALLTVNFSNSAYAELEYDTEDPMFFEAAKDFLSRTGVSVGNDAFRAGTRLSYGVNGIFTVAADIKYQESFRSDDDGFADVGLLLTYRTNADANIKTDIFAGFNFTGPGGFVNYADTVYTVGARMGRQWAGMTLAGTAQTSWVFDETRGMAFIDLMPEIYFRITEDWKAGVSADFRIATNPNFDREWVSGKFLRQYGRTQYVGHFDYEFDQSEWQIGAKVNVLF